MNHANPFAPLRASEYTDEQINQLWVKIGAHVVQRIIEPTSAVSKYILGGKGTGKTHLLRYHSYPVSKLRPGADTGIAVVEREKTLAVFLRATAIDPLRFAAALGKAWQQLFGVYLELRLGELVLEAVCDIKERSAEHTFDDAAYIREVTRDVTEPGISRCHSVDELHEWIVQQRVFIDRAVNRAAFTGVTQLALPFAFGTFCFRLGAALHKWNASFADVPLLYLIDEIENFDAEQQEVLNTLIRYAESRAAFRLSGRLYSRRTFATIGGGEANREGSEFTTVVLDSILRRYPRYLDFAERFVMRRLTSAGSSESMLRAGVARPSELFEEIDSAEYYRGALRAVGVGPDDTSFVSAFVDTLRSSGRQYVALAESADGVAANLTMGFPLLLQKLNLLLFCKRHRKRMLPSDTASSIRGEAITFMNGNGNRTDAYANAYSHYAADLFAQLCRESKRAVGVPYAGFEFLVKMSSGNPRNLLILLGRVYAICSFRGVELVAGEKVSIRVQTEAAVEAGRFFFEADSNYGTLSDAARDAVSRLATLLRTARFALNIPEVSPLAVSFADENLSSSARQTLQSALNYSLLFDIGDGRPDRNSDRLNRKVQLNPLLSPRWGLPISMRGDISLSSQLANSIFAPSSANEFELLMRGLEGKWNQPFSQSARSAQQRPLF